ncbi:cyclic GMP-AMP synthase isoform X2 [Artibeus jamaicensis]|uniref:cyclic GMP-AMP synthase isoform X2 n=1 Tax=Artibeus jamaicensis TaxID=9417 RepID=UPI00235AD858|nr:cyclic GMP-AMP synthase isoform X2 [Artibeus jamaicensis]
MDPQPRKATRSASKASSATFEVMVQITKGAPTKPAQTKPTPTESTRKKPTTTKPTPTKPTPTKPTPTKPTPTKPSECLVVPNAARPEEQKCSTRASRSQRKKSAPGPQKMPQVRARGARTKKAPQSAEDFLDGQAILAEPPAAQQPPLPRVGSCRERGARSAREQKSQPWPVEDPCQHPLVPAPSLAGREVAPCSWKPKAVLSKLRLSRSEISAAAEVVNEVVDHLLRRLQSSQSEFKGVELLRTGSYYEQVKVSSPNEFDIMFKLDVPRIELKEYRSSAAHYFVKFKRNPKGNPLSQFVENEMLSASKMLSKFRQIIKEEIKNIEEDTWRLSFSHIEKDILKNHGQSKTCCETNGVRCCRKDCLKLMKYLLEQLKKKHEKRRELKKFCSYHVKTAFFHTCTEYPDDSQWQPGDVDLCFDRCLEAFLQHLREEHLDNFFIPGVNLFSQHEVDKISKEFLLKEIEYERNNGFPVFKES